MALDRGTKLRTVTTGVNCYVLDTIGEGGQGSVYRVSAGDEDLALKWYSARWLALDAGLRERLEYMVERGSPTDRYLWPIELVTDERGGFGYVMNLRPRSYHVLTDLLAGHITPSFSATITAAIELAHNFHELHALGLSYQDISARNVFIDEAGGTIRICDCDNVSVNNLPSAIGGTIGYMAPEVGLGRSSPSGDTDRFSLAVLLFEMLALHHPLLGARELAYATLDRRALLALFCESPCFIFDPDDASNRPVPGRHDRVVRYWALYPPFLRELFTVAFTDGLRDPKARVYERKWREALVRLRDTILRCAACGAENFHQDTHATCWSCSAALPTPLRLRAAGMTLVLSGNACVFAHHVDPQQRWNLDHVVGRVVRHPERPGVFGLRNETSDVWTVTAASGRSERIVPRRVARLAPGSSIDFGRASGVIA